MAKIFKISGYAVDYNGDYSPESIKRELFERMDMFGKHIEIEERDIGEFYDDHPLNYMDSPKEECEKYFK